MKPSLHNRVRKLEQLVDPTETQSHEFTRALRDIESRRKGLPESGMPFPLLARLFKQVEERRQSRST